MKLEHLLNHTVQTIPPSGIRKFFDIASEMDDAISLGVGEPDFVTPWTMREAAIYAVEQGQTQYTSNWGTPALRQAIAAYQRERFGLSYCAKDEIMVTVGASEGIDLAMRAILEPGDEVLVPSPSYVSYAPCVTLAGGVPVGVQTDASVCFRLTPEAVRAAITPKTKAIILPYPNNPTGGIMAKEHLEALAEALRGTDILVVSDEIYAELTYTEAAHVSIASIPDMWERTVLLSGFSKCMAMTGWRVGYACGPREVIALMLKIHQFTMLCAPNMSQAAALEGLRSEMSNGYREISRMRRAYNRRRRIMVAGFNELGLDTFEPMGAFYCFPCIQSTGLSSDEFCQKLLEEEHVAVVPGGAFGDSGEGYIRCCYAVSTEHIYEALRRIGRFVSRHHVRTEGAACRT